MNMLHDRLYGAIKLPPIMQRLLLCPGLCRLREVAMANVPFLAFPAFASTTRYEHSIGVCHLADLAATGLGLNEQERIELMAACLYHDVATPPFAHAMEEVLAARFGFDHETYLRELLLGRTTDILGPQTQIFLGRQLALQRMCQSAAGRHLGLDLMRIANIAVGDAQNRLGSLVVGDIDLDNIDNVARASTAMGIREFDGGAAEALARSFEWHRGIIGVNSVGAQFLKQWARARATQYEFILCSWRDFALQTMVKHIARILLDAEGGLSREDWCLTDQEFVHQRANRHPRAAEIMRRMRLADTYRVLCTFWVEGDGVGAMVAASIQAIEDLASECFGGMEVIANYMIDRRKRALGRPLVFFGQETQRDDVIQREALLLGFFSPTESRVRPRRPLNNRQASSAWLKHSLGEGLLRDSRLSHVRVRGGARVQLVVEDMTHAPGPLTLTENGASK